MIQIILQGITKIEQHEPQWRVGVNSGDPEGYAVPSPLEAAVLLLFT